MARDMYNLLPDYDVNERDCGRAAEEMFRMGYRKQSIDTKVLKKAIVAFGTDMQLNVAVEEFAELTKEICKRKRGADNFYNIIEEMADCYIMLEQMKIMFCVDLEGWVINDVISKKVERLAQRLEESERGRQ